jgi:hypothetical protein
MKRVSVVLLVIAAGCRGGPAAPSACEAYAACCDTLGDAQRSTCDSALSEARSAPNQDAAEASCRDALAQLQGLGYCQATPQANTDPSDMATAPVSCPNGFVLCGGYCVDTSSDPVNCGACGVSAVYCSDGKPSCPPGETPAAYSTTGWGCVNLATDAQNCGAVGHVSANDAPVGRLFECRGGKCGGRIEVVNTSSTDTNCIAECTKLGLNCDDGWFSDPNGRIGGQEFHAYESSDIYGCGFAINPTFDSSYADCGCIQGDPCGDFVCPGGGDATCADDTTLRSYAAMGTCSNGVCTIATTDTHCPNGCVGVATGVACNPNPCGLVVCNSPPPPSCVNATTLRSYASTGSCAGGTCSYAPTDRACNSPPSVCYQSAGSCANGQCSYAYADGVSCGVGGVCKAGLCTCTPSCSGKQCGDDGCGGSCGSCGIGKLCTSGSCVTDPNYCDPVANLGCANPNQCLLLSNETTRCALAGTGTDGSACSATLTCAGGYGCFAGTCRHLCNLGSSSDCAAGQACNGVSGWVTYGVCK